MSKIAESVEVLVKPYAESLGLEIVEVEYGKKVNGNNLTIFIDKKDGVTIDDCEALHRLIDAPLDELDPTNGSPYTLNVSSCGLDRPLKKLSDYLRNIGKNVEVKLYSPLNGSKLYKGIIESADEQNLVVKDDKENIIEIKRELIATVLPVVEI
ncbi:MAG: ribosome maturation factor RimP [Clostridia bacterium]|nr:ribosome maturation factor RimP [Clostridia bacterium]